MNRARQERLNAIGDELERLEEAGKWNFKEFRRLYAAALEACGGPRRELEMFGPFMRSRSYIDEANRLSRKYRAVA